MALRVEIKHVFPSHFIPLTTVGIFPPRPCIIFIILKKKLDFKKYVVIDCRDKRRERERENHPSAVSGMPPAGDRVHKLDMCPEQGSNQQPLGAEENTQSTEAHWPGIKKLNF